MRVPVILSFIWCALSILMGYDAAFMIITFIAMIMIASIGYMFGRENPEE